MQWWWSDRVGPVDVAFTGRDGGASSGPWASLNLGSSNGDDPAVVEANLRTVQRAMGAERLHVMSQVHGTDFAWVEDLADGHVPTADILLSATPGAAIVVRVADCTPIVIADPGQRLVAVVHAGRAGLVQGAVHVGVEQLAARGASELQAWIGPRACGQCYELPDDMVDQIAADIPQARSRTRHGTAALDVGAGVRAQLEQHSVQIHDVGQQHCTIEDEGLFSYRRQGTQSGRMGAVAVIR